MEAASEVFQVSFAARAVEITTSESHYRDRSLPNCSVLFDERRKSELGGDALASKICS